jgi:hypothetical protein
MMCFTPLHRARDLIHLLAQVSSWEDAVKQIWTNALPNRSDDNTRIAERRPVTLPARLTWRDQRGTTRFASVTARNVSDYGVYVECQSAVSIPVFRLVQFQLEREVRESDMLPDTLRRGGRVLSAVYRVSPASAAGTPQGLALRLMVEPRRRVVEPAATRATA